MIKHIIQKCVIIVLTVGYILGLLCFQGYQGNIVIDMLTMLIFGLWFYILLDDFDLKALKERRAFTPKHVAYEMSFLASLILITVAYLIKSFGWAVTSIVGSVICFCTGCALYVYCLRLEDEYVSTEIENCQHLIWVLKHLKNKAEDWTEDKIVEHATREFRFYPKANRLERGVDAFNAVDSTGRFRTLAEIKAENPNAPEVAIATRNYHAMAVDYINRRNTRLAAKAAKKAAKQQKKQSKEEN